MLKASRALASLSPPEGYLLALLLPLSILLWPLLRIMTLPRILRPLRRMTRVLSPLGPALPLERLYRLADLASRLPHGESRCLARSLLVAAFGAVGRPVDVIVGVRRSSEGLKGHAWVESGGRTLGDCNSSEGPYTQLVRL